MLVISFVCFLSFVSAAQDFSGYQSDGMLLEAGFIAFFLPRPGFRPGLGQLYPASQRPACSCCSGSGFASTLRVRCGEASKRRPRVGAISGPWGMMSTTRTDLYPLGLAGTCSTPAARVSCLAPCMPPGLWSWVWFACFFWPRRLENRMLFHCDSLWAGRCNPTRQTTPF